MSEWNDAKAGRMAVYVIVGLALGLAVLLALVVTYAGLR